MNIENKPIDINKTADLSMLSLTEDEKEKFSKDMASMIGFANKICELECEEDTSLCGETNILRKDNAVIGGSRDELLKNAKTTSDGYITVPRVVEG